MALALLSHPSLPPFSSSKPPAPAPALTLRSLRFSEISLLAGRSTLSVRRAMGSPDRNAEQGKEMTKAADHIGPVASGGSGFPLSDIPAWVKFVVGALVCVALPYYKKILRIEATAQKDGIAIADVVEEVAEVTEKIASTVADAAPNSKIKELALEVEHFAETVDKDAEISEAFIRKAAIIEDEVHKFVNPLIKEAEEIEKETQANRESSSASKENPSTITSMKENSSTPKDSSSTDSSKPT